MSNILFLFLVAMAVALAQVFRKKPHPPYPPGPPTKPFIGNAFDISSEMQWIKYLEWSKRLNSDIIHVSAMNKHIVVLHKMEDITELMERRSAIYSSRPWIPAAEMLGIDNITALIPYGDELRRHRKILHESLRKEVMPLYHSKHTEKVHLMINRLLIKPEDFASHCKWLAVAVTMSTTFGYDISAGEANDRYVTLAEHVLTVIPELLQPGRNIINVFPFLRFIPPWIPGASTQKSVVKVKKLWMAYKTEPYEYVKSNLLAGTSKDCMLTRLLRSRLRDDGATVEDEDDLKDTMATMYLAGAESTQSAQLIFFMAMALYPSVQKRVRDEIDRVVGRHRLPTFDDRPSLPHVDAVLRETLRWRLVAPLAIPHMAIKDDIYKGFYIPKGTLVLPNAWAISQDETIYSNHDTFNPNRFFNPDGTLNDDKIEYAFGYGRRLCPGRHMARDVLWLMMASVLATFNIFKEKDENGVDIDIDQNAFTSGLSRYVIHYCKLNYGL
ncbi:cytochrome P450 [Amanita rubescens]|nr:cytochrome P450 [Amanita rubescens]